MLQYEKQKEIGVKILENHYFENLYAELKGLFDEQGFKFVSEGVYENEKKAVKIEYKEDSKTYCLSMADIGEGEEREFVEITSWLFDETQDANDAASVGMDFCECIREKLGVKIERKTDAQIDLPSFRKDGEYDVTAFAKKMLDVFPQLKEPYREHVAKYGNFLYLDFFGEYLVPELVKVYSENAKKSVKKLTDAMEAGYVSGNRDAVNVMVAVLAAACSKSEQAKAAFMESLGENTHFKQAVNSFIPNVQKNAKLSKALLKKENG